MKLERFLLLAFFLLLELPGGVQAGPTGRFHPSDPPQFVRSIQDFETHMLTHIDRVVELGAFLKQAFPEHYNDVDESLLREFLALHDQSKINRNSTFLRRHGLNHRERSILEELYEGYGQNFDQLPPEQQERRKRFVREEVNRVDQEVANEFFRNYNMVDAEGKPSALGKKYLEIEKIADGVDRGMSAVSPEEFGKKMERASRFMRDPKSTTLALHLEKYYPKIVAKYSFRSLQKRRNRVQGCGVYSVVQELHSVPRHDPPFRNPL